MSRLLAGVHDREGAHIVPAGGWCVDTIALSEHPAPTDYAGLKPDIHWIARLNWGYGSRGTIPIPVEHGEMAARAGAYVAQSRGCRHWIVGNEPNHSQERPAGRMISPGEYARAFMLVRDAIKRAQPDAIVICAPIAPWNVESGDWLEYQRDMLVAIGEDNVDGVGLHAYIRACEPGRVSSQAVMDAPYQDRHSEWLAYLDTLEALPGWAKRLPAYMSEANPLDGWRACGVMEDMLDDVAEHNGSVHPFNKIQCVCFYRYPDYDHNAQWGFGHKPEVVAEFQRVAPHYPGPGIEAAGIQPEPQPETNTVHLPSVGTGFTNSPAAGDYWPRCLTFVLGWEGGWADHPADPGGATMKGITLATYTSWRESRGEPAPSREELRGISDAEVAQIYRSWYWVTSGADKLPWPLCLAHFDTAVNAGVGRAADMLERSGGDFVRYMGLLLDWYSRLDAFKDFGRAWTRRRAEVLLQAGVHE